MHLAGKQRRWLAPEKGAHCHHEAAIERQLYLIGSYKSPSLCQVELAGPVYIDKVLLDFRNQPQAFLMSQFGKVCPALENSPL